MPNWCNNRLTITHKDPQVITDLRSAINHDNHGRLFQHIKPMPDELRDTTSPDDSPNWYDWSIDNWGTKWDAHSLNECQHDAHTIVCDFDTAWAAPIPVFEALAEQGFEVEAYYVEYDMMFAGEWHCDADGIVSEDYSGDISEYVPPNVDEVFGVSEQLAEWAEEEKEYA